MKSKPTAEYNLKDIKTTKMSKEVQMNQCIIIMPSQWNSDKNFQLYIFD